MEDEAEDNKNLLTSCSVSETLKQQSEFAAVCSFIHHFGAELGIYLTFPQLVQFLSLGHDVNWKKWETLHIKLLNKLKYRARPERWEPVLGRFLQVHAHGVEELLLAGDILQRCSGPTSVTATPKSVRTPPLAYYELEFPVRTKVLLLLLETQFDRNQAFKEKVNLRSAVDLRFRPLGTDVWGRTYWLLKDSEVNLLLYREESEHEKIELVCETTDEIRQLHRELKDACPPESKLADILASQCAPSASLLETVANALLCNGVTSTDPEPPNSTVPTTDQEVKPFPPSPRTPPPTPIACVVNGSSEPVKSADLSIKAEDTELDVKIALSCAGATGDQVGETTVPHTTTDSITNPDSIKVDPYSLDEDTVTADTQAVTNVNRECTQPTEKAKKGRSNKRTTKDVPNGNDLTENSIEVRRSGRQRKPVEFLTMEPLQPKRARSTVKANKPQEEDAKDVQDVEAPKPAKKRKSKLKCSKPQEANVCIVVDEHSEESKQKKKKKKKRKRHHKGSGHSNPWLRSSSSSESLDEDDTFERELLQRQFADSSDSDTPRTKKNANTALDWSDKPESDFNPDDVGADSDADSLTQGRNLARQKRLQRRLSNGNPDQLVSEPETQCQICFQSHLPEWMLLCDRCDLGHHAMCLRPPLLIIPEGDWFCPRCQHATLVTALTETADAIDAEQKKQTLFKRMQERLNYVNISMTNILADEDEDDVDTADRTRKRVKQILYRESESSAELSGDPSSEAESFGSSDDEKGYWGRSRRAKRPKRSTRTSRFPRVTRNRRMSRLDSGSEGEATTATSDSVSGRSPVPAPRSTRKRQAQYDLSEAFKQLDEVLEADEKYQEEKRQRKCRKTNASDASENEAELPEASDRQLGRSRGKDLSTILGPDWKNWEPSKSRSRRRRVVGRLSSSSEASEGEGKGHPGSGDDDEDFKPPSEASSVASELESDEPSSSDAASSDNSWLCVSRHARRTKLRLTRTNRHRSGRRNRGKPIPRFEASEDEETLSRPKRRTRTVVSYQESDDQDEDAPPPRKPNPRARWELSDNDERGKSANDELSDGNDTGSPKYVSSTSQVERKNRRRILSSSESEYQPQDDESPEKSVQGDAPPVDVQNKPCSQEMPSVSDCSDEFSSTKLKISESSPEQSPKFEQPVLKEPPVSSTLPPVDAPDIPNAACIPVEKPDNSESNIQSHSDEESVFNEVVPNRPHTHLDSPSAIQVADHLVVNESPDLFD